MSFDSLRTAARPAISKADPLNVQSVEKAFRVLEAFDSAHPTLSLTQLAESIELDKSAAQRFAHTLTRLGYLHKNPLTKRFELTTKALKLGYHYIRASRLVAVANPYLLDLSRATEETVSLTVLENIEVVFIARFMSRHVLSTDTVVGTRMPAFCTSSGVAMLSRLDEQAVEAILASSNLRPYTPYTTWKIDDLRKKINLSRERGFATAVSEYFIGDLSLAAPLQNESGQAIGAINIGVSQARYTPEQLESHFADLVVAAALAISQGNSTTASPLQPAVAAVQTSVGTVK